MRRGLALIWLGATAVVAAIVGFISYGAGWAAGAAARAPAAAPYYYGPHFFGFGFLPFLFLLLVLFLVFRAGRRRGPWGWGYRGYGAPFPPYQPSQQSRPGVQPPPAGDPWQGWPQRPPTQAPPEQEKPAE
jgi:hypothetical protein